MTEDQKQARNTAYRNGLCTQCLTAKHSAGRTLCNPCHDRTNQNISPLADRNNYPCRKCEQPTRPGYVTCATCQQALKRGKR